MKKIAKRPARFALKNVAAAATVAVALVAGSDAWALGLGRLNVQSALGETLKAEIDISSITPEEAGNLNVRVASPDAYRAAGVDYNSVLQAATVTVLRRADGTPYIRLTSDRVVQEPFVDVILEVTWNAGRLVREYTLLFDPPTARQQAAAAPSTAPAMSAAPAASAAKPGPRTARTPTTKPAGAAAAPSATASSGGAQKDASDYRVRSGDTLSSIARRTEPAGVSLDQMIVGLYRANPDAFVGSNMNRLKAGSVLSVPSAQDAAKSVTPSEARQVIQAQASDFNSYRQKLAGAVPAAKGETASRKATGQVQAEVQDKKGAGSTTADKLTLDKGRVAGAAASTEDKIARERERKEAASRVTELNRNLEDLKKLQAASSSVAPSGTGAKAAAPAPAVGPKVALATPPAPAPTAAPAPAAKPATPSVASAPAAAPAPAMAAAPASAPAPIPVAAASAPATAPLPAASAAAMAAAGASAAAASDAMQAAPAMAEASAPAAFAAASRPAPAKPKMAPMPPQPVADDGIMGFVQENAALVAGGGVILALLAGLGIWRLRGQRKVDGGETSFLESRLQPDSFFGASGGQRIDTRDATGAPSSMSYSLSQLDAIGDVDPVAEADVYLAYGRDLQAEEILKEAMRANPERLAVRAKLLEVYAKRRDTKGYELLATQLYGLTNGQGDDWAKAQELGRGIDPENPLYQAGGAPAAGSLASVAAKDTLGVSTMPQSVVPSPSRFEVSGLSPDSSLTADANVDVDLDLSGPGALSEPEPVSFSQPATPAPAAARPAASSANSASALNFDLPDVPTIPREPTPRAAAAPAPSATPSFDLGDLSLDLDAPASIPAPAEAPTLELPTIGDASDPLVRKFELAEEFRQIGDMEGARDLLQEVAEKATGALKSKAQNMLDTLA